MTDKANEDQLTDEQLQSLIAAQRAKRERECMEAVRAALAEHRCRLVVYDIWKDGKLVRHQIQTEAEG